MSIGDGDYKKSRFRKRRPVEEIVYDILTACHQLIQFVHENHQWRAFASVLIFEVPRKLAQCLLRTGTLQSSYRLFRVVCRQISCFVQGLPQKNVGESRLRNL